MSMGFFRTLLWPPSAASQKVRCNAAFTVREAGFFSSQPPFYHLEFLEILMLFYVKFFLNLLRTCYALHDFLRARGSIFSGLHPFNNLLHALVLLCHTTPQFGIVDGNTWDQSKQSPSGLKIPTTVFVPGWFMSGRKSGSHGSP
jgi:hypothetical protein